MSILAGGGTAPSLQQGLLWLAGTLAASVGFLLLHHAVSLYRERRFLERLQQAACFLAPYLSGAGDAAAAVERARRSWGRRAVATVLRRARRPLAGPREQAISKLLEEMGECRRLARSARHGGALRRGRALRLLAACGGTVARRELLRASADQRPQIRRIARDGLVELRDPFAIRAAVAAFLGEPDLNTSWSRSFFLHLAAYAPGELRRLAATRELGLELQKLALEALAETGDAAALPLALEGLRSPAGELRAAAVRLLGAVGDDRWTALLAGRLADRVWFVRAAAARALGGVARSFSAYEALSRRLTDSHWWVRSNAARSLAQLGPPGVHRLARAAAGLDGFARRAALPELLRLQGPGSEREGPGPEPEPEPRERALAAAG